MVQACRTLPSWRNRGWETLELFEMTDWVTPTIVALNSVFLAAISRLRWRCVPDPETGRCTFSSGCSEIPLQSTPDGVDAHEFTLGHGGPSVLLVSAKT